jgi:hypothetical protein
MRKLLFTLFVLAYSIAMGQLKGGKRYWVGFYNLENLFDTKNDTLVRDDDRTPNGKYHWTSSRLEIKLKNISKVITRINLELKETEWLGLGVCEVENFELLKALTTKSGILKNAGIIHFDSPDLRGIDVGFLYNQSLFRPIHFQKQKVPLLKDRAEIIYTRDLLVVSGIALESERIHFIITHWPSRSGGEKRSEWRRKTASYYTRKAIDSINSREPQAKIIVMGDFNDDPVNESILHLINPKSNKDSLINFSNTSYRKGLGSIAHRDKWHLFDQIIGTKSLLYQPGLQALGFGVYTSRYLQTSRGRYRRYPFRTYAGLQYQGGYSDHFPVVLELIFKPTETKEYGSK